MATGDGSQIYQFITNNNSSFYLRWKKRLTNHQNVSKYYEHDCLQKSAFKILLFMSLLTCLFFENSHTLAGIFLIFKKKRPRLTLKEFQYQIWT